jgi:hypothetical protein
MNMHMCKTDKPGLGRSKRKILIYYDNKLCGFHAFKIHTT